jgi:hypothetical protein
MPAARLLAPLLAFLVLVAGPAAASGLDAQLRLVEQIRGVTFTRPVVQKTIHRDALAPWLREQLHRDLPLPVEEYFDILRSLHLLDASPDALDQLISLYEAQILAFYDPREKIYYSVDPLPPGFGAIPGLDAAIVVHELTHALQDQRFGAGERLEKLRGNWDAQLAYHAVVEGEATLVMLGALAAGLGASLDDLLANGDLLSGASSLTALAGGSIDAPRYFVESMTFPYAAGLRFVAEIYRKGGWEAVDALHARPPRTTEEVLHPELYGTNPPAQGKFAAASGAITTSLGEFHWRYLLGEEAAAGWAADTVTVKRKGGRSTVEIATRWDSTDDAREFATALRALLAERGVKASVSAGGVEVKASYAVAAPAAAD